MRNAQILVETCLALQKQITRHVCSVPLGIKASYALWQDWHIATCPFCHSLNSIRQAAIDWGIRGTEAWHHAQEGEREEKK